MFQVKLLVNRAPRARLLMLPVLQRARPVLLERLVSPLEAWVPRSACLAAPVAILIPPVRVLVSCVLKEPTTMCQGQAPALAAPQVLISHSLGRLCVRAVLSARTLVAAPRSLVALVHWVLSLVLRERLRAHFVHQVPMVRPLAPVYVPIVLWEATFSQMDKLLARVVTRALFRTRPEVPRAFSAQQDFTVKLAVLPLVYLVHQAHLAAVQVRALASRVLLGDIPPRL